MPANKYRQNDRITTIDETIDACKKHQWNKILTWLQSITIHIKQ